MSFERRLHAVSFCASFTMAGCLLPNDYRLDAKGTGGHDSASGGNSGVGGSEAPKGGATSQQSSQAKGGGGVVAKGGGSAVAEGGSSFHSSVSALGGSGFGGATKVYGGASSSGGSSAIDTSTMSLGGATVGSTSSSIGGTTHSTLLDGCSLLLHLDESNWVSDVQDVMDASGLGNNGMAMSGAVTTSRGRYAGGALFDGNGYLDFGHRGSLQPTVALTVLAWIYPSSFIEWQSPGLVAKRMGYQQSSSFAVFIDADRKVWVDIDGEDNRFSSSVEIVAGVWTHVAVVYDGSLDADSRTKIYLNGQLDTVARENSTSITHYESPLEVGRLRGGGHQFVGTMDEVALFTRALTDSEIKSIATASTPLQ